MITDKNINKIIIGLVVIAVAATSVLMVNPGWLGIRAASAVPEYAEKLFPKDAIVAINITADPDKWDGMLKNATAEEYIPCDITINEETFKSVGIRPKGNSSLSMVARDEGTDRFSFKIKMDEYVDGQSYYGLDKFVLNNMQGDATYMKEYLSYNLFQTMGVNTPLYAYVDISLNGEPWGFYLAIESEEEAFAQRNYGADYGMLYKPESQDMGGGQKNMRNQAAGQTDTAQPPKVGNGMPGGGRMPDRAEPDQNMRGGAPPGKNNNVSGGADLVYTDDDPDSYSQIFNNAVFKAGDEDKQRIITALKALSTGENLEQHVDTDEVLRYFAVNTALVNLDSYVCSFRHNYYLYEQNGRISILPWDLNLSFAGFQSRSAGSAVNFPIDTPVSGVELTQRPLIGKLLETGEYQELYHEYLKNIADDYFGSGRFEETINRLDALIGDYVKNDPSAFFTYDQYEAAIKTLNKFGTLRAQSIQGQLSGTVPSTTEGQSSDPDQLIDASRISMSTMGTQGNGGGLDKGSAFRERQAPPQQMQQPPPQSPPQQMQQPPLPQ